MTKQNSAIMATQAWVQDVVIELNLCPFAKKEWVNKAIRYCTVDHSLTKKALRQLLADEITLLDTNSKIETTLIIVTQGLESFFDYLAMLDVAEDWLDDTQYRGIYQLASFHPDYCFEGEANDAPSNYTNRSPFPMFHILREASMEKALASYKYPERIPEINQQTTKDLGINKLQNLLAACSKPKD
jgi:hypothetical protein